MLAFLQLLFDYLGVLFAVLGVIANILGIIKVDGSYILYRIY